MFGDLLFSCSFPLLIVFLTCIYFGGYVFIEERTIEKLKHYNRIFLWVVLGCGFLYVIIFVLVKLFEIDKEVLDFIWKLLVALPICFVGLGLTYLPVGLIFLAIYFFRSGRGKFRDKNLEKDYQLTFWWLVRRGSLLYLIIILSVAAFIISYKPSRPTSGEEDLLGGEKERVVYALEKFFIKYGIYPTSLTELFPDFVDRPPDTLGKFSYFPYNDRYTLWISYGFLDECNYYSKEKIWSCSD